MKSVVKQSNRFDNNTLLQWMIYFFSKTLFKGYVLKISINCLFLKEEKKIIKQHWKNLDPLLEVRDKNLGISTNPNTIITNLARNVLTEGEYYILQDGLKHQHATCPKENDILAYAEDIWEQIDKANICNNNTNSKCISDISWTLQSTKLYFKITIIEVSF